MVMKRRARKSKRRSKRKAKKRRSAKKKKASKKKKATKPAKAVKKSTYNFFQRSSIFQFHALEFKNFKFQLVHMIHFLSF